MSSPRFETFLARLLSEAKFRADFLRDPHSVVEAQDLDAAEQAAALAIDRPGLVFAARSFTAKRAGQGGGGRLWQAMRSWRAWL